MPDKVVDPVTRTGRVEVVTDMALAEGAASEVAEVEAFGLVSGWFSRFQADWQGLHRLWLAGVVGESGFLQVAHLRGLVSVRLIRAGWSLLIRFESAARKSDLSLSMVSSLGLRRNRGSVTLWCSSGS